MSDHLIKCNQCSNTTTEEELWCCMNDEKCPEFKTTRDLCYSCQRIVDDKTICVTCYEIIKIN
jgi:hypothetical protein